MRKIVPVLIGAIIGLIVGYPLSYFMQPMRVANEMFPWGLHRTHWRYSSKQ